ncbi:Flp family type IVb pilin [Janthinobacterium sp. BJB1]|nr:Flp family type IVb pilin [Janthinobacterium sp. GW458P]MBE3027667.1 Flp family type IVb pilin [Janthinobacterium sp. GW458P]PHV15125.1 Flp family type IVb pilin [Janthinobacterium sp. BJB303]PJC97014.1 Flp family type IVb pilin [Janthinobacterium sp. BJB1]
MQAIKNFIRNEDGVTAIEYGLIAALIAVALAAAVKTLGGQIKSAFEAVSAQMPAAKP